MTLNELIKKLEEAKVQDETRADYEVRVSLGIGTEEFSISWIGDAGDGTIIYLEA